MSLAYAIILTCLAVSASPGVAGTDRPDIVLVVCDDFNPFYTGFAGDPDAKTPHLDVLASDSAVFSRCYTASPVCMPARTSLVSGLYPHNTGCWGNTRDLFLSPRLTSMFADFKQAGYTTAVIGKTHWLAGQRFRRQFDSAEAYYHGIGIDHIREVETTFGSRTGRGRYQDFLRDIGKFEAHSRDMTQRLLNNQYVVRPSLLTKRETCDWMMTDLALESLREAPEGQPLAMMVAFSNPHSPFDPVDEYATMYDPETISLRENVRPFQKYGTQYPLEEVRRARAAYLGKISYLDELLGRLITELKSRGRWDNTILVFTADHGLAVGEHRNIAKGHFWDEVARVPLVMRIPGLTDGGMATPALAQLIDLYPTLVEAGGGEVSPHVLGRSLLPVLRDPGATVRDAVFCEIHHRGSLDYMVRDARYKWFTIRGDQGLYDLDSDPFEQRNLIESEEYAAIAKRMRDRLRTFLMTEQVNYSKGYQPLAERVKAAESNADD